VCVCVWGEGTARRTPDEVLAVWMCVCWGGGAVEAAMRRGAGLHARHRPRAHDLHALRMQACPYNTRTHARMRTLHALRMQACPYNTRTHARMRTLHALRMQACPYNTRTHARMRTLHALRMQAFSETQVCHALAWARVKSHSREAPAHAHRNVVVQRPVGVAVCCPAERRRRVPRLLAQRARVAAASSWLVWKQKSCLVQAHLLRLLTQRARVATAESWSEGRGLGWCMEW